jgi:DNA-binding MarR family transcriptional regulator
MTTPQKIVAALERIGQALRSLLLSDAMEEGLSITQAQVLLQCYLQPGRFYGVTDLAEELDLSQPTISDAITTLQRKGLLQKLQREDDRRAVVLVLTPRGKAIARRLWIQQSRRFEQLSERFSPEEQAQFLHFLLRFIAFAYEAGHLHTARTCLTCRFLQILERSGESAPQYFCTLLETPLALTELRTSCPEHELPQEETAA